MCRLAGTQKVLTCALAKGERTGKALVGASGVGAPAQRWSKFSWAPLWPRVHPGHAGIAGTGHRPQARPPGRGPTVRKAELLSCCPADGGPGRANPRRPFSSFLEYFPGPQN